MPNVPITLDGIPQSQIPPTAQDKLWQRLRQIYEQVASVVNGRVNFGDGTKNDNIDGSWVTVTPPNPNVDFTVNHGLNRIPTGYLVMSKSVSSDVYTGSIVATTTQITLRVSVAPVTLKLFIL